MPFDARAGQPIDSIIRVLVIPCWLAKKGISAAAAINWPSDEFFGIVKKCAVIIGILGIDS